MQLRENKFHNRDIFFDEESILYRMWLTVLNCKEFKAICKGISCYESHLDLFSSYMNIFLSNGQCSWLQIQRSGFNSQRYQIFWGVMGQEWGSFSLMSTIEDFDFQLNRSRSISDREKNDGDLCGNQSNSLSGFSNNQLISGESSSVQSIFSTQSVVNVLWVLIKQCTS
jgi:hypothetical protein